MALEGACNHCGLCCKREGGFMIDNCMISPKESECKFYREDLEGGHCLVYIAMNNGNIEDAKDKLGNAITQHQIVWFKRNCIPWPEEEMINRLLPSCGFYFTDV